MNEYIVDSRSTQGRNTRRARYALPSAVLVMALLAAFLAYRAWAARQPVPTRAVSELISATELEERYGVSVRLIGVTAAGGLIDFRLHIADADKAKQLLEDPARTVSLWIEENDTTLATPPDVRANLTLEDGGTVFFLLPNAGNAVKPGTPVVVQFGDLRIEPIAAQ